MVPAYCQGRFGFRVNADGTWLVGPETNGRTVYGRLRESEHRTLKSTAERVLSSVPEPSVECHIHSAIPGVAEDVTLVAEGRTVVLRGAGGLLDSACAPGNAAADAALFALADRLMRRYYPRPF
jgi:hypothetical protein